ncbi:unnamed protein product, partial [Ixodes persulcatus]
GPRASTAWPSWRGQWRPSWRRRPYGRVPDSRRDGPPRGHRQSPPWKPRLLGLGRPRSPPPNPPATSQHGRGSKGPGRHTDSSPG